MGGGVWVGRVGGSNSFSKTLQRSSPEKDVETRAVHRLS